MNVSLKLLLVAYDCYWLFNIETVLCYLNVHETFTLITEMSYIIICLGDIICFVVLILFVLSIIDTYIEQTLLPI